MCNEVVLTGTLLSIPIVRYTPAGMPVAEFDIQHHSQILEAGQIRDVTFETRLMALGAVAEDLRTALANHAFDTYQHDMWQWQGFITSKSLKRPQLIVHVTQFKRLL